MPKIVAVKDRLEFTVSARFNSAEATQLERIAKEQGVTVSTLVRKLCLYGLRENILKSVLEDICNQCKASCQKS